MRIIMAEAGIEYPTNEKPNINTPEKAALQAEKMAGEDQECVAVLCLNAKNQMTVAEILTAGILDCSLVHPREVFRRAIAANAAAIVLIHNHPSGDTTPSAEDIKITRRMIEAGKIVDVKVMDHVIVSRKADGGLAWMSMRDAGLCDFVSPST